MIKKRYCQVYHADIRELIAERIEVANGFFTRFKGLLGRKGLQEGEGLLLSPCSSIHCFGMQFPIDTVFLDKKYKVVDVCANLNPGSMASHHQARYVLELKAGEAERNKIEIGEQLSVRFG